MSVQFQGYDVSGMTEFVIPEGIKEIAPDAFKDCTRLKRVVIPQGVRKIGEQAFYGCEQLEEVVLPDGLEEIGKSAFCRCKSLKRLLLPDSVYIIDDSAFKSCEALNEIRFPENMYFIGKMAFGFCVSLKSVWLPSYVWEMHDTAFDGCENLKVSVQPEGLEEIEPYAMGGFMDTRYVVSCLLLTTLRLFKKKLTKNQPDLTQAFLRALVHGADEEYGILVDLQGDHRLLMLFNDRDVYRMTENQVDLFINGDEGTRVDDSDLCNWSDETADNVVTEDTEPFWADFLRRLSKELVGVSGKSSRLYQKCLE